MKNWLSFLLGVVLGPFGVLVACCFGGKRAFVPAINGVGVWCCSVFFLYMAGRQQKVGPAHGFERNVDPIRSNRPMPTKDKKEDANGKDAVKESKASRRTVQKPVEKQCNESVASVSIAEAKGAVENPKEAEKTDSCQPVKNCKADQRTKETMEKLIRLQLLMTKCRSADDGCLPDSFAQIVELLGSNIAIPHRDAWGRRIRYAQSGGGYTFTSAGPDRVFDTEDDLVMTNKIQQTNWCLRLRKP